MTLRTVLDSADRDLRSSLALRPVFAVNPDLRESANLDVATEAMVVVVGSEGRGLSRLVGETCDLTVSIPMAAEAESLNASVAAAVMLAEIARRRRG